MTRAQAISIQQPLAFAASGRRAVDRTPAARDRRSSGLNMALLAFAALLVGAYFAAYVATVLAVGSVERAEDEATEIASALHDAERAAAKGGALSYGDAATAGLAEVAPRYVTASGAVAALSVNGR